MYYLLGDLVMNAANNETISTDSYDKHDKYDKYYKYACEVCVPIVLKVPVYVSPIVIEKKPDCVHQNGY